MKQPSLCDQPYILPTLFLRKKKWHFSLVIQLFQIQSAFERNLVLEPLSVSKIMGSKNLGWRGKASRQGRLKLWLLRDKHSENATFDDLTVFYLDH